MYNSSNKAVALAASALEGIFKTVLREFGPESEKNNYSLKTQTSKIIKDLTCFCALMLLKILKHQQHELGALGKLLMICEVINQRLTTKL